MSCPSTPTGLATSKFTSDPYKFTEDGFRAVYDYCSEKKTENKEPVPVILCCIGVWCFYVVLFEWLWGFSRVPDVIEVEYIEYDDVLKVPDK